MKLGILGGGQLGRMIALAGYPLGVSSTVLEPATGSCAAEVCECIMGEFENHQVLYELARTSDVVTFEFENVPVESARWLAERVPVFPPPRALEVSQERLAEKQFLTSLGIPTPPFAPVENEADFRAAFAEIGLPAVLKTRRFGYDGKGQAVIRTHAEADAAWQRLGGRPLILEGFVPFDRELSLIAARGRDGQIVTYPLIENTHIDGILHRSVAPAQDLGEELSERAAEFVSRVLTELDYVGVLAVEWFQDGPRLLANEMAPRVHNSGHWTIEGALTSQFENHAPCRVRLAAWARGRGGLLRDVQLHRKRAASGRCTGESARAHAPVREVVATRAEGGARHAACRECGRVAGEVARMGQSVRAAA